jgi:hypothetical protein
MKITPRKWIPAYAGMTKKAGMIKKAGMTKITLSSP